MQKFILVGAIGISSLLAGCAGGMGAKGTDKAEAVMAPTQGNKASGTVTFVQSGDKLKVFAEISGLTPGLHGFHIHEKGDCSAPDGTSAGGHFNPSGKPHGDPAHADHHAGDLTQLVADANGVARQMSYVEGPTLADGQAAAPTPAPSKSGTGCACPGSSTACRRASKPTAKSATRRGPPGPGTHGT